MDDLEAIFGDFTLSGKYIKNQTMYALYLRSNFGLGMEFTSFSGSRSHITISSLTPCCLSYNDARDGEPICMRCAKVIPSSFRFTMDAGPFDMATLRAHMATFFSPMRFAFIEPLVGEHVNRITEADPADWATVPSHIPLREVVTGG